MVIIETINNSFLLNKSQKEYLIWCIHLKDEIYINNLLKILQSERKLILSLLKEYKNRNTEIWVIKQEIINENMKKIKKLEQNENEVYDLEKELENI